MRLPFGIDPLQRLLEAVGLAGPIVAALVLLTDRLLRRLLHRDLARSLRFSTGLAWLYLFVSAIRCFSPDNELEHMLRVVAAVALSLALAQLLFVVVIDFVLGRNGRKPLPPLSRYGLLGLVFLVAALAGLRAGGVATVGVLASGAVILGGLGAAVAEVLRQVGAGVLVQYTRPFDEGDVVHIASHPRRGRVLATNWRTTTLRSSDGLEHLVPNVEFVVSAVTNYGQGDRAFRRDVDFDAPYEAPPERVRHAVLSAMRDVPGVEPEPRPMVIASAFHERGVAYQLRYWTRRAEDFELVDADCRARIWYALVRNELGFPLPVRALRLSPTPERRARPDEIAPLLQRASLFSTLPDDALRDIALHGREAPYGVNEVVVKAGEQGKSMFVILDGEVSVLAEDGGRELFRLSSGDFFGEMALLTGGPRKATVVTATETRTFEIDEPTFRALVARHPDVAESLSDVLAQRQSELSAKLEARVVDEAQRRATKGVVLARLKELFGIAER